MPQITLSVPQEKLPLLQEFLQVLGIEGRHLTKIFNRDTRKSTTVNSFEPFSWENYCNELEFE